MTKRVRSGALFALVLTASFAGGCDDEGGGGAGATGGTAGGGGTATGAGAGAAGGFGGMAGAGGSGVAECALGDQFCLSHAERRYCTSTAVGLAFADESCPAGSGCLRGECVVGACSDECTLGTANGGQSCELYDIAADGWPALDPTASLHDRARDYTRWLQRDGLSFGGVGNARYADPPNYTEVIAFGGVGDSAIWTGTYLAAEALRLRATGAADAREHVIDAVETLHLWFNVTGDPAMLARFVKPSGESVPYAIGDLDCAQERVFCGVDYQGESYDYIGHISRDQYQGVMLGYSLAYEALSASDEATRALVREDVVEFVEELMLDRTVPVRVTVNGTTLPSFPATMRFVVLASRELANGAVEFTIDTGNLGEAEMRGFQEFMPNLGDLISQVPGLGWATYVPRSDSAVMLSSFFRVAMQVTDGVAGYEARRAAIVDYFLSHDGDGGNVTDWLEIAKVANADQACGDKYYANNIIMEPLYNLARLEDDAGRLQLIRQDVLGGWLWSKLDTTKNSFFSFIYASNVPGYAPAVTTSAATQLGGFPLAPRVHVGIDLLGDSDYQPHEPGCTDQCNHATAVDVAERAFTDFMWQRHPWQLVDTADLAQTAPGVDYLVAYWLGRRHDFLADDGPSRCLVWH